MQNEYQQDEFNSLNDRSSIAAKIAPIAWFGIGVVLGSVLEYYLDPQRGRRRRSLAIDKTGHWKRQTLSYAQHLVQSLKNQGKGFSAKISHRKSHEIVDDETLANRVRSEFGRKIIHVRAIHVIARDGNIYLSGPILAEEADKLIRCAQKVRGVKRVINRLDVHQSAQGIPSLQGEEKEYLQ